MKVTVDRSSVLIRLAADPNAWQTNAQFSREFLAGLNPVVISLVKVATFALDFAISDC